MNQYFQSISHKIQNWEQAKKTVEGWQALGWNVVFTNGCFDLVHYGHLYYLAEAAALGQKLVVALNSDRSIKKLKGKNRPIQDHKSRFHLMASLQCVDLVVEFEQDTPLELITLLQPDVLVKGGDWKAEQIVGSEVVLGLGGEVRSLAFVEGYSTTKLEEKIRKGE